MAVLFGDFYIMTIDNIFEPLPAIYIFTNTINGKQYVGEAVNMKKRFSVYKCSNKGYSRQPINNAIQKYGFKAFDIEVIYRPYFDKPQLLKMEYELIKELDTLTPIGYNICAVGTDKSQVKLSENHKRLIGLANTNPSQETRLKLSNSRKGMKFSEEHRKSLSKAKVGRHIGKDSHSSKRVFQYTKDNEFIREFDSIRIAANELNITNISRACKNNDKTAGGFKWQYAA